MFEEFYTTKMSPEKKSLENRFSKILGKGGKISKTVIIATTCLLVVGAVSVSVVLAAFDSGDKAENKQKEEKEVFDYTTPIVVYRDAKNTDNAPAIAGDVLDAEAVDVIIDGEEYAEGDYTEVIEDTPTLVFVNPIEGDIEIIAPFGERKNPITGDVTYHNGVDIAVKEGDIVRSAIGGTVKEAEYTSSLGNYVIVENGDHSALSAHLASIDVAQGDEVMAGQQIGKAGKTGMTTGANLHFELKVGENYADPKEVLVLNPAIEKKTLTPEQVLTAYYANFAEANHTGMKQYCTESFIQKRFRDNMVGGKIRAELVSITPVKQEDSRGIHFVVSSKNLTEGKTYGVVSDGIYYTLLFVNGEWKIDSWYLKEDFEKIYG